MNPIIHSENHRTIVYDADRIPEPQFCLMEPDYWLNEGAIRGHAAGRGQTLLLETSFGPAVLRAYLRGGLPSKISKDRYLYTGLNRTRPFREFRVLQQLAEMGLPAPAPLAAECDRGLLAYRGSLLMERIMDVRSLGDVLGQHTVDSPAWAATGRCIRKFHVAGLDHADLNANNLLLNETEMSVHLVDFDRCTLHPGTTVDGRANLARLKRSLVKLWPGPEESLAPCWQALLDAYHA